MEKTTIRKRTIWASWKSGKSQILGMQEILQSTSTSSRQPRQLAAQEDGDPGDQVGWGA